MGGVIVESSRVATTHTEDVVVDNVFKDNNKRKKRRSRRSKPNYSLSACSSVSEICMEESSSLGDTPSNHVVSNGHQQMPKDDSVNFSSMSAMHIHEENADENLQNQHLIRHENSEPIISKSGPEPFVCEEPVGPVLVARRVDFHFRQKYFPAHSSEEAISKGLEKGELLRALFRVNAHNKMEAYCKIDGVPTDVLINGVVAQNRAFEGDTVAIVIDPPSLWPKMKGSNEILNNTVSHANCSQKNEALMQCQESLKGKKKLCSEYEHASSGNYLVLPEDGTYYENGSSSEVMSENSFINESPEDGYIDSNRPSAPHASRPGCFGDEHSSVISLEKLCTLVSLHPSKRPTGVVVAVIGMSPRRDSIVGFLSVKQWLYSRDSKRKDFKKNKRQSDLNHGYILLTPTDPKFTKMIVPVMNLPESVKKRLENGDLSVENDLVAAKVVDWAEESYFPEARVIQIFGRGSDIEAQIAAILFENAVDASEFSAEALSCLPHLPWEVPQEELQSRRDLRNLCVFTIDSVTTTDRDDALSVESLSNGNFRVGVHIADVSYFVSPDTALDIDAQSRSTSVYLVHCKIPMLPPMLSDNLASLNPGVDRLAFSIFWNINPMGEVLDRWIGRTIIRSCCKLSYEHAQEIIDGVFDVQDASCRGNHWPELYGQFKWRDVTESVKCLDDLSKKLKENRFEGGAISFESSEIVFLFDEDGIPYDSARSGRQDSNFLVEEFMLLANRTAAEVIARAYPSCALLRRHPEPNPRKLREFEAFCSRHGLTVDISSSSNLHCSLENIREELKDDPVLIDILMSYASRPMQLAAYFCSGDLKDIDGDWGHYALAVPLYTHFTSPLRRYPDIVVHRTLAAALEAENIYLEGKRMLHNLTGKEVLGRCFTGMLLDKDDIESVKAQEALSNAALKFRVPCTETLVDVASHCNLKKPATRYVKDATNKLYMWVVLKRKRIVYSEARVLGLGPRFMSIYISKLSIERRIYYDEIEGLTVEWLDATSTLVLSHSMHKCSNRKSSPGKCRKLEEVALIINPTNLKLEMNLPGHCVGDNGGSQSLDHEPAVFPLTVNLLSTIPVALHAVGGVDGPLDIVARLYISSYFH